MGVITPPFLDAQMQRSVRVEARICETSIVFNFEIVEYSNVRVSHGFFPLMKELILFFF